MEQDCRHLFSIKSEDRSVISESDQLDFSEIDPPAEDIKPELIEVKDECLISNGDVIKLSPETEDKDIEFINTNDRKLLSCAFCSYQTIYKYNFSRHRKTHMRQPSSRVLKKCKKCPFETHDPCEFQRHSKVHSETIYKCLKCNFVTKYKENLPKHDLVHKSPNEYSCDECEYQTNQKLSLKRHMLTHRPVEEAEHFKCSYCDFVTKNRMSLNNHVLKMHKRHKLKKHKCPECDFSTYHKFSLKGHLVTHRKPGEVPMYKCPECPYETKNKTCMPNHMKSHKEMVPCPQCQKLISQRGMRLHLKSHESGEAKRRYKCNYCNYGTLYLGNLSRHMKLVHSNKEDMEYKYCSQCSFKTVENARLKRHITEVHSVDAPQFKCDQCEFMTKFKSCLKRHVDTAHGNLGLVKCPVCFKTFANIYTLRIHMKLHRTEDEIKMLSCENCSYKTRHNGSYKEHMLRHKSSEEVLVDDKSQNCLFETDKEGYLTEHVTKFSSQNDLSDPVCCPCCCFQTSSNSSLHIHMSKMHLDKIDPDELWSCTHCEFKTLNKRTLKEHLKNHMSSISQEVNYDDVIALSKDAPEVKQEIDLEYQEIIETDSTFDDDDD